MLINAIRYKMIRIESDLRNQHLILKIKI